MSAFSSHLRCWSDQGALHCIFYLGVVLISLKTGSSFFPFPPSLFFIPSAARVSFACIVFEQCSVWTARSQLRIQARSTDRLLSPAFPSDSINASVSLKKGDATNRQARGRRGRREWLQTKSVVRLPQRADSPSFEGLTKQAGWGVQICVCVYLWCAKSLIRRKPLLFL